MLLPLSDPTLLGPPVQPRGHLEQGPRGQEEGGELSVEGWRQVPAVRPDHGKDNRPGWQHGARSGGSYPRRHKQQQSPGPWDDQRLTLSQLCDFSDKTVGVTEPHPNPSPCREPQVQLQSHERPRLGTDQSHMGKARASFKACGASEGASSGSWLFSCALTSSAAPQGPQQCPPALCKGCDSLEGAPLSSDGGEHRRPSLEHP